MSDYKMDIRGELGLGEYNDIHQYIGIVDKNDNFTITLDSTNKQNISMINSMLKENSFEILEEGISNGGNYYIIANKK